MSPLWLLLFFARPPLERLRRDPEAPDFREGRYRGFAFQASQRGTSLVNTGILIPSWGVWPGPPFQPCWIDFTKYVSMAAAIEGIERRTDELHDAAGGTLAGRRWLASARDCEWQEALLA